MIVKVSELKGGISCVYKISYPNSRVYIGSTTDLRRRMWEHNNLNKNVSYNDEAVNEFGRVKEVFNIRTRKMNGEERKVVFSDYEDKVSLKSGFDAVWNDLTRRDILPEVISHFEKMSREEKISFGNRGEKSGRAKVTENDVRYIRNLYDLGMEIREINNIYDNLSYSQVLRISKRKTWKHVE